MSKGDDPDPDMSAFIVDCESLNSNIIKIDNITNVGDLNKYLLKSAKGDNTKINDISETGCYICNNDGKKMINYYDPSQTNSIPRAYFFTVTGKQYSLKAAEESYNQIVPMDADMFYAHADTFEINNNCPIEQAIIAGRSVQGQIANDVIKMLAENQKNLADGELDTLKELYGYKGKTGIIGDLETYVNLKTHVLKYSIYIDLIGLALAIVLVILFLK